MKRTIAARNAPRRMNDILVYGKAVCARMSEGSWPSLPADILPTLKAAIDAFEDAVVAVTTRTRGAASVRKATQATLLLGLQRVQRYVQSLAESLSPNEAAALIERAGIDVKDARGPSKPPLRINPGPLATSAHVYARAAKTRASYEFQYAAEGLPWISLPSTTRADAVLEGLLPGVLYSVRMRVAAKGTLSDFSAPVTFRAG